MAGVGILANGVTEILKKLSFVVANEITLVWDFKDELKNLQTTLNMILVVMEDAENKQLSEASVRLWMGELKSIAYDAEEILDEYAYEVILHKHKKEEKEDKSNVLSKVRNVFSSSKPSFICSWKLAHKVKKINEKFNKIAKCKADLGLQTIDVGSSSSHELMMKNRETNSFVPKDWKIVGRKNDKSTIIKMLLEEEEDTSNNQGGGGSKHVSVIAIVGMGGLGKTTMAQQVYNHEAVKRHFELKVWICVSDPFDIKKLYKNIANSIGKGKEYDDATTMDALSHMLQDAFSGKKFLLVLDDVWNENPEYWNNFKKPFMVGRGGSKILVTTRNEKSALIMVNKFQPYSLGILNENDCWSLFKEIAFGSAVGVKETPKLMEIGKEMVNRCKGLPLAIIFLGSLMRYKKKEREWKVIRDTKLWHQSEVLPSLRLSYDYLPSHLKLCFSYCCLFPKDWIIDRETLIRLWMAEGFLIETPGEAISLEEIGNEYFHNLLSNFFFQDVERKEDGDITTCKMHDLVHDLARSVIGNHECLIVENALDIDYISEETRRLNLLIDFDDEEILPKVIKTLKAAKKLRTIFINKQKNCFDVGNALEENKRLRVLDLSGSVVTSESSSSIGGLKHLRYLVACGDFFLMGIGRLRFLQTLTEFTVGDVGDEKKQQQLRNAGGGGIEELECLNNLRGGLNNEGLQNVKSGTTACRANFKDKNNLGSLNLSWSLHSLFSILVLSLSDRESEADGINNNNHEAVMEGLLPHPNLRTLEIKGFQGSKLPRWMRDSSCLPNLENLTLSGGVYEQLVGFGALPSLRSLTLECMFLLKEWQLVVPPLPSTTSTSTSICFPFPLLEELRIKQCPFLTTITPTTTTIFPSLKVLNLQYIYGRAAKTLFTNNLNSLTSLRLREIPGLISLPHQGLMENNNTLLSLEISYCLDFKGFLPLIMDDDDDEEERGQISQVVSSSSSSSSLQSLTLYDCPALRFYPNIRSLTSLQKLVIQDCEESRSLQDHLTCLSSSSSSLEHQHLAYVKILKKKKAEDGEEEEEEEEEEEDGEEEEEEEAEKEEEEEVVFEDNVVFEWRKSSFF